jgi:nucleoid DNA-binding protein
VAGRREQLIGKVQERYGLAKEEATKQVDAFVKNIEDAQESVGNRTKVRSVGQ